MLARCVAYALNIRTRASDDHKQGKCHLLAPTIRSGAPSNHLTGAPVERITILMTQTELFGGLVSEAVRTFDRACAARNEHDFFTLGYVSGQAAVDAAWDHMRRAQTWVPRWWDL